MPAKIEDLHRQRTEKTAIDYFVVYASDQDTSMKVSDADVRAIADDAAPLAIGFAQAM